MRIKLALAALFKCNLEEVCVAQPQGFVVNCYENKVYRLWKALYELKQAPRVWLVKVIFNFGIMVFQEERMSPLFLTIWVLLSVTPQTKGGHQTRNTEAYFVLRCHPSQFYFEASTLNIKVT